MTIWAILASSALADTQQGLRGGHVGMVGKRQMSSSSGAGPTSSTHAKTYSMKVSDPNGYYEYQVNVDHKGKGKSFQLHEQSDKPKDTTIKTTEYQMDQFNNIKHPYGQDMITGPNKLDMANGQQDNFERFPEGGATDRFNQDSELVRGYSSVIQDKRNIKFGRFNYKVASQHPKTYRQVQVRPQSTYRMINQIIPRQMSRVMYVPYNSQQLQTIYGSHVLTYPASATVQQQPQQGVFRQNLAFGSNEAIQQQQQQYQLESESKFDQDATYRPTGEMRHNNQDSNMNRLISEESPIMVQQKQQRNLDSKKNTGLFRYASNAYTKMGSGMNQARFFSLPESKDTQQQQMGQQQMGQQEIGQKQMGQKQEMGQQQLMGQQMYTGMDNTNNNELRQIANPNDNNNQESTFEYTVVSRHPANADKSY